MSWGSYKTEHSGAKNGGGHWGSREEAKQMSRRARRSADAREESGLVERGREQPAPIDGWWQMLGYLVEWREEGWL